MVYINPSLEFRSGSEIVDWIVNFVAIDIESGWIDDFDGSFLYIHGFVYYRMLWSRKLHDGY